MNEDLWYMIELKGKRRRAGQMRSFWWAGHKWITVSMPLPDGDWHSETYPPSALYSFMAVSEDEARAAARDIWLEWQEDI